MLTTRVTVRRPPRMPWRLPARRARSATAVLATALLAVVLTGCEPNPYTAVYPQSPRVAVVGDSLTAEIDARATYLLLADAWNASVTGIYSFAIRDQFDMLETVAATAPQVVVIALGSNDLRLIDSGEQTWEGLRADAAHALAIVAGVPCVVWVGVDETAGAYENGTLHSTAGWAVNWTIADELRRARPLASTGVWADWAAASRDHPEFFVSPTDVHLTDPAGEAAFAALIRDSVRTCPGNPIVGNVETVAGASGVVSVSGWVADPDVVSTQVHVYVDGQWGTALVADLWRPDVKATYPRVSGYDGFAGTMATSPGPHEVCVYAINQGPPATNPLLACRSVLVPA